LRDLIADDEEDRILPGDYFHILLCFVLEMVFKGSFTFKEACVWAMLYPATGL